MFNQLHIIFSQHKKARVIKRDVNKISYILTLMQANVNYRYQRSCCGVKGCG